MFEVDLDYLVKYLTAQIEKFIVQVGSSLVSATDIDPLCK
jgi:hypothetical protein